VSLGTKHEPTFVCAQRYMKNPLSYVAYHPR